LGGVKLQVKQRDLTNAREILKDAGLLKDEDVQSSNFFKTG